MSSLSTCQLGAKVWEIGKTKFGFDNRKKWQEGWEPGVTCDSAWHACFSPTWLAVHWYCEWRQICSLSCYPSVLEASLLVFCTIPWCPRSITWSTNSLWSSFHPIRSSVLVSLSVVVSSSWEVYQGRVCEGEKDFRISHVWLHPGKTTVL